MYLKEYLEEQLNSLDERVSTVEMAVDMALENSKNKKEAIDYIESLARKESFVKSNKKKIVDMINKLPKNMFEGIMKDLFDDYDDIEEIYEDGDEMIEEDDWTEADEMDEAAVRVSMIRKGKRVVKRRSNRKGYKIVGGREVRMSPAEQRTRRRAQRRAARKRKSKRSTTSRKRKMSLRRRKSMNL